MVYVFDEIDSFTADELELSIAQVSSQRRVKALKYRYEIDRKLSVKAYLLLKEALHDEYGIMENPIFSFPENGNGKPSLQDYPHIHFNLSHCPKGVACAVSDLPIGLDIEEIKPFDKEVAAYVCSNEEYQTIINSPNPDISFSTLWTKKESLLKLTGEGISNDLPSVLEKADLFRFSTIVNTEKKYVLSSCVRSANSLKRW